MRFRRYNESPPPDITSVMGRLLSDQVLREEFANSPHEVAQRLGLEGANLEYIAALDPVELEQQAETLVLKRFQEVRALAPNSLHALGGEALTLFRYYAQQEWPSGHRRHLIDTIGFLEFVNQNSFEIDATELRRIRRKR
ncbi:MAG: hypothetical protein AAF483_16910 [Planctomycetota bacterium]